MSGILMQGIGAPFLLLIAFVLLIALVGPMVLADIVVIVLVILGIVRIARTQGASFRDKMMTQGRRVSILNEWALHGTCDHSPNGL